MLGDSGVRLLVRTGVAAPFATRYSFSALEDSSDEWEQFLRVRTEVGLAYPIRLQSRRIWLEPSIGHLLEIIDFKEAGASNFVYLNGLTVGLGLAILAVLVPLIVVVALLGGGAVTDVIVLPLVVVGVALFVFGPLLVMMVTTKR